MSEQHNREALESYIQAVERHDLDGMEGVLNEDYAKEFPQSSGWEDQEGDRVITGIRL